MPTVMTLGWGKLKVCMYFKDHNPPHVHVLGPNAEARFSIETMDCFFSRGFTTSDLSAIQAELTAQAELLKEKWDELKD